MLIYQCGTWVKMKVSGVAGIITGVTIRFDTAIYEVSYWSGDEFKTGSFYDVEFDSTSDGKSEIGFKK